MVFFKELKERVKGMGMKDAILEVNHWCHERVTYQPSDNIQPGLANWRWHWLLPAILWGDSPMLRKWEHPDLHFTFPTIKTANMGSEHKPVSLDFIKGMERAAAF